MKSLNTILLVACLVSLLFLIFKGNPVSKAPIVVIDSASINKAIRNIEREKQTREIIREKIHEINNYYDSTIKEVYLTPDSLQYKLIDALLARHRYLDSALKD